MKQYYFRFVDENKKPTGFIGFATASDDAELFFNIDIYGDPTSCQLLEVTGGRSFCVFQNKYDEYSKFEDDGCIPDVYNKYFCWEDANFNLDEIYKT